MTVLPPPINIYYSYANEDENLLTSLDRHLRPLKHQALISTWNRNDTSIVGQNMRQQIDSHLNSADIILLLVSADFMADDYCYNIEMPRALERHKAGETRVIPIIIRPTNWQGIPWANLQVLPTTAKPVTSWPNLDEAFTDVVKGIYECVDDINHRRNSPQFTLAQPVSIHQTSQNPQSSSSAPVFVPSQINVTTQTSSSSPATSVPPASQLSQVVSKKGTPDAMKAATDKAVRRLSEDKLGFAIWVKALGNFIKSPDTTTPLTIGIDGAWGTGKSSFMYMLQDLLEPSFSFWDKWREIRWPWLKWFGLFLVTLPIWMVGKLMVYMGKNRWNMRRVWLQDIADALSYDPEIDIDINLKTLPRRQPFWASISL